jgi:hypothetical protein
MNPRNIEKLDKEHKSRIAELRKLSQDTGKIDTEDIFVNKIVANSVKSSKVILGSYDAQKIICAYPFSPIIYVFVCPRCNCLTNQKDFMTFLERRAIIPVLLQPYSNYPSEFISRIIPFTHMSWFEYEFFRTSALRHQAERALCLHCAEIGHSKISSAIKSKNLNPIFHELADMFYSNLHPFIEPDLELIDCYIDAVEKNDIQLMSQIEDLSNELNHIRTIQAFNARSSISREILPKLLKEAENVPNIFPHDVSIDINDSISKELHLSCPEDISVSKYLDTIEPYRAELSGIVESLLAESTADGKVSLAKLSSRLAELNDQLFTLPRKKRFLFYRASSAFLRTNKTLLASSLLAGVMGYTGNLVGCGASLAGGIGAELAKRTGRLNFPAEIKQFGEEVGHCIRPQVHQLLSRCLSLDIKAIQIWDIKEKLERK